MATKSFNGRLKNNLVDGRGNGRKDVNVAMMYKIIKKLKIYKNNVLVVINEYWRVSCAVLYHLFCVCICDMCVQMCIPVWVLLEEASCTVYHSLLFSLRWGL